MPFNYLLWNCLLPGKTSVRESGKVASLKPDKRGNESVLAFKIDTDDFRNRFDTKLVADALFFHKTEGKAPTILLVELKGRDVGHGIDQLGETLRAVKKSLGRRFPVEFRAVVRTDRGVPKDMKARQKKFNRDHSVPLLVARRPDLRNCL